MGRPKVTHLTLDQLAVLQMASEGLTYQQSGRRLEKTEEAARHTGRQAMKKLNASSIAHAVAIALNRGDIAGPLVCDGHE